MQGFDCSIQLFLKDAEGEGSSVQQDKAVTGPTAVAVTTAATATVAVVAAAVDSVVPGTSTSTTPTPPDSKKKSNRCQLCRKKVGLTGMLISCFTQH